MNLAAFYIIHNNSLSLSQTVVCFNQYLILTNGADGKQFKMMATNGRHTVHEGENVIDSSFNIKIKVTNVA